MKIKAIIASLLLVFSIALSSCTIETIETVDATPIQESSTATSISDATSLPSVYINDIEIPAYSGDAYTEINNNEPFFTKSDITTNEFETYSDLDRLGRCGVAFANISNYTMPTEERGKIGQVKPSGWHSIRYDNVDGKYLYNRCHLIGYQLAAENANKKNLITGTRYLNIVGMLDYENKVAEYVKTTNNHVLYRVTPIFYEQDLVSRGVLMEGYSVEDSGAGIKFNIFAYNIQPDININYATGDSCLASTGKPGMTIDNMEVEEENDDESLSDVTNIVISESTSNPNMNGHDIGTYESPVFVVNKRTKKYHTQDCKWAAKISEIDRDTIIGEPSYLERLGYVPCKTCKPDENH